MTSGCFIGCYLAKQRLERLDGEGEKCECEKVVEIATTKIQVLLRCEE